MNTQMMPQVMSSFDKSAKILIQYLRGSSRASLTHCISKRLKDNVIRSRFFKGVPGRNHHIIKRLEDNVSDHDFVIKRPTMSQYGEQLASNFCFVFGSLFLSS